METYVTIAGEGLQNLGLLCSALRAFELREDLYRATPPALLFHFTPTPADGASGAGRTGAKSVTHSHPRHSETLFRHQLPAPPQLGAWRPRPRPLQGACGRSHFDFPGLTRKTAPFSRLLRHKGMRKTFSNPDPHGSLIN
jgi:hypothetical protein